MKQKSDYKVETFFSLITITRTCKKTLIRKSPSTKRTNINQNYNKPKFDTKKTFKEIRAQFRTCWNILQFTIHYPKKWKKCVNGLTNFGNVAKLNDGSN